MLMGATQHVVTKLTIGTGASQLLNGWHMLIQVLPSMVTFYYRRKMGIVLIYRYYAGFISYSSYV